MHHPVAFATRINNGKFKAELISHQVVLTSRVTLVCQVVVEEMGMEHYVHLRSVDDEYEHLESTLPQRSRHGSDHPGSSGDTRGSDGAGPSTSYTSGVESRDRDQDGFHEDENPPDAADDTLNINNSKQRASEPRCGPNQESDYHDQHNGMASGRCPEDLDESGQQDTPPEPSPCHNYPSTYSPCLSPRMAPSSQGQGGISASESSGHGTRSEQHNLPDSKSVKSKKTCSKVEKLDDSVVGVERERALLAERSAFGIAETVSVELSKVHGEGRPVGNSRHGSTVSCFDVMGANDRSSQFCNQVIPDVSCAQDLDEIDILPRAATSHLPLDPIGVLGQSDVGVNGTVEREISLETGAAACDSRCLYNFTHGQRNSNMASFPEEWCSSTADSCFRDLDTTIREDRAPIYSNLEQVG